MLISIVFSFRNEQDIIPELLERTRKALGNIPEFDHELIFVNDDSTDDSLTLLSKAHESDPRIKVVNMSRCFGVSECVLAGMQYASGDLVVYMDADLQDPPELIPTLVEKWKNTPGVEVVYTTRTSRQGEGRFKMGLTKLGYWILGKTSNVVIHPNSGDFKLLSRRAVRELLSLQERKPFVRGMISWIGFKHAQVLYDREARFQGDTKFPVLSKKVIYNFLDSALISFSDAPLKIALLIGGIVLLGSFSFIVWVFIQKWLGWAIPGWSAIMATVLFIGGCQTLILGTLGLYIHAIYLESKGRPNFIVRDTVGLSAPLSDTATGRVEISPATHRDKRSPSIDTNPRPPGAL